LSVLKLAATEAFADAGRCFPHSGVVSSARMEA
jgi:hypothetical protein